MRLKTYKFKVVETLEKIVEVEAFSYDEALEEVECDYYDGHIELDYNHISKTDFIRVRDVKKKGC